MAPHSQQKCRRVSAHRFALKRARPPDRSNPWESNDCAKLAGPASNARSFARREAALSRPTNHHSGWVARWTLRWNDVDRHASDWS